MSWLITLIIFILVLGVIVLVHEFGHFIFSKIFGVYVHEFAIGMGPKIISKQFGETVYSIRAIPIGGFCSLAGEDGEETDEKGKKIPKKRKLFAKPIWQRFLILFFGAGNNFILAFLLLFFVALFNGAPVMDPVIGGVTKDLPFEQLGIEAGDKIISISGHKTKTTDDVQVYFALLKPGEKLKIEIEHDGKIKEYNVKPVKDADGNYKYGIEFVGKSEKGFVKSLRYSYLKFEAIIRQMVIVLSNLFTGKLSVNNLSGPVGIYGVVGEARAYGLGTILNLTALLSINVGFMNLIPFPAFDGGRIFLLLIEKIRKKPLKAETENYINTVGFILIILLAIYVTGHDIFMMFK